jgi:alpha-mannosidase
MGRKGFTCVNDGTYASDFRDGEIRLTLLRSPVYSAHRFFERTYLPQDRFSPRIDQGEHVYRFWFSGGDFQSRWERVSREAQVHNERPMALAYFPPGEDRDVLPLAILHDHAVQMTAFKRSESGDSYVIRLFEPTGEDRVAELELPSAGLKESIPMRGYEIKTLRFDIKEGTLNESGLMEL